MEFIDTHCHLDDDAFENDLPDVLDYAYAVGVRQFVNIGYEPASWTRTLKLAARFPNVSYALGLHPNSADQWSSETAAQLEMLLEQEQPVAIGETGLDFFREHADHDAQREAFRSQLALGQRFELPVVIHMRGDVEREIMSTLGDFPDVRAIVHSFDGSAQLRDFLIDRGDSIGVGGLMTRAGSVELREVLRQVPIDAILLETDSPYLMPKGLKGRRNSPASLPQIATTLAALLGVSAQTVARQTSENAVRVLGLVTTASQGGAI
jgi:TatD DNase family protein